MTDPVTLALIVGGGQLVQGLQGAAAGRAQAKVATQQAEAERRAATLEERQQRERSSRFRSRQLARFAKAGVTTAGTPSLVLKETAIQQERDALAIRFGGEVRRAKALDKAALAKQAGTQALVSSIVSAGGTLLGSGSFKGKGK